MKKAQIYRRVKTLFASLRDMFLEEEPRDKARRTMRGATEALNRIVYQRFALEHEYQSDDLDEEARMWCQENLKRLSESERAMSEHLTGLRQQYRTLMLQDLFYKTLNDPTADCYQQAQAAILELQAAVEAERTLRSMPQSLQHHGIARRLPPMEAAEADRAQVCASDEAQHDEIIIDHEPVDEKVNK